MATRGCFANTLLFLVIVFIPIAGQIIETIWVFDDERSLLGKALWLVVIWGIPFIGPFLYLWLGQRPRTRGRIMFGQTSTYQPR